MFAAQQIKQQARTLAVDRGIRCITLDYDEMRGMDSNEYRLFWRPPAGRTHLTGPRELVQAAQGKPPALVPRG